MLTIIQVKQCQYTIQMNYGYIHLKYVASEQSMLNQPFFKTKLISYYCVKLVKMSFIDI